MKKKKYAIIMISILFMALCVYADSDNPNCYDIFGSGIMKVIKDNILAPLRVIAPILLLIFTSMDFAKNVFKNNGASDKNGGLKEAFQRFLKRAVATLLIFFAQNIISFILGLVGLGGNCLEDDIEIGDVKITCADILYNGQAQQIATCENGEFCDRDGNITNSEVLQTGVAEDDTNYNVHCRGYVSGEITSKSCTIKKNLSLRKIEQCYCNSSIERCQFTKDPAEGYEAQRLIQGEAACIEYNRNKMMGCFYSALSVRGRYEWSNSGNATNMQYHPEIRTKEECDAKNIIIIEVEKPTIEQLCANPTYTGAEQLITVETEHEGYTLNTEDITKKEAGSYPIRISLNENYRWKNGNKDDITLYCPIRKKVLNVTTTDQSSTRYPLNADNECNAEELIPGHTIECKNTGSLSSPQTEARKIISQVIIRDANGEVTSNYDIKLNHGKLIVSQEQAVITCLNATYDGSPKTIATCEGGTIQNATQTYYRNGGYTITCNGDADHRNAISKQCNIGKRSITVKASDEGPFEYDGTVKRANNECNTTNLANGDTVTCTGNGGSRTDAGTSIKTVGNVQIYHGSTNVTNNYLITKENGHLTISKRQINVRANDESKEYDGLPLMSNNCYADNLVNSGSNPHIISCINNIGSQTNVGNSAVKVGLVTIKEGSKDVTNNYEIINKVDGKLEVTPREIVVKAEYESYEYDSLPHNAQNTFSLVDGTLVGDDRISCTCSGTQREVGKSEKKIESCTITSSRESNPELNYSITKQSDFIEILPSTKAIKPTAESHCQELTYNGREQSLTKNAGLGYSFSNNIRTNAGSQQVTATLDSGYKWSDGTDNQVTFSCIINPKPAKIKAIDKDKCESNDLVSSDHTITCSSSYLSERVPSNVGFVTFYQITSAQINEDGRNITSNYRLTYERNYIMSGVIAGVEGPVCNKSMLNVEMYNNIDGNGVYQTQTWMSGSGNRSSYNVVFYCYNGKLNGCTKRAFEQGGNITNLRNNGSGASGIVGLAGGIFDRWYYYIPSLDSNGTSSHKFNEVSGANIISYFVAKSSSTSTYNCNNLTDVSSIFTVQYS